MRFVSGGSYPWGIWVMITALLAIGLFGTFYQSYGHHPDLLASPPTGWYQSEDQHYYLVMAQELARGKLETYHFGLGYPILGALFVRLLPADPFLLPNLLVTVFVAISSFWLGYYFSGRADIGFMTVVILFFLTPLGWYLIVPWNSTAVLFWTQAILWLVLLGGPSLVKAGLVGLGLVWIFAARYIDVLWLLPLVIWWLGTGLTKLKQIRFAVVTSLVVFGTSLVLWTHDLFFGSPWRTPYINHRVVDQDLGIYRMTKIPGSLWGVFIGGSGRSDTQKPLLVSMPILWLVPYR